MTMVNENLENSAKDIDRDKVRYFFEKTRGSMNEFGFKRSKKNLGTLTNHSRQNQFQHQSYL